MSLVAALSFARPHRDEVGAVAKGLAEIYGRDQIFFDEWSDLATLDAAARLEAKYRDARLVVVFLSPEYGQESADQRWTRLEWNEVFRRHTDWKNDAVYLFQFGLEPRDLDRLQLPGLSSGAFPTAADGRPAEELVEHVVHRLDGMGVPRNIGPGAPSPAVLLEDYRQKALDRHGRVSMICVSARELLLGMEDIYVPLSLRFEPIEMVLGGKRIPMRAPETRRIGIQDVFRFVGEADVPAIMGEAGSGKTTALQKLLHVVLTKGPARVDLPEGTVPVWLRAAELKRFSDAPNGASQGSESLSPGSWTEGPLGRLVQSAVDPALHPILFDGRPLLLLFDGVDEIADPEQRSWALQCVDRAVGENAGKLRAVVSCRHSARGFDVVFPDRFRRFAVSPLDDEQRRDLSRRWFAAAFGVIGVIDAEAKAEEETERLFEELGEVYRLDEHHRVLVSTPLFATLQCALHLIPNEYCPAGILTHLGRASRLVLARPPLTRLSSSPIPIGFLFVERPRGEIHHPEVGHNSRRAVRGAPQGFGYLPSPSARAPPRPPRNLRGREEAGESERGSPEGRPRRRRPAHPGGRPAGWSDATGVGDMGVGGGGDPASRPQRSRLAEVARGPPRRQPGARRRSRGLASRGRRCPLRGQRASRSFSP